MTNRELVRTCVPVVVTRALEWDAPCQRLLSHDADGAWGSSGTVDLRVHASMVRRFKSGFRRRGSPHGSRLQPSTIPAAADSNVCRWRERRCPKDVKAILQVAAECTMAGQHTMALAQYHRARAVWRKAAAGLTPSGELSPGETLFFAVAVGSVLEMAGMESDALLMYRRCENQQQLFRLP